MLVKIVKKSANWSKHGKRISILGDLRRMARERIRRPPPRMYTSFEEMWREEMRKDRRLY